MLPFKLSPWHTYLAGAWLFIVFDVFIGCFHAPQDTSTVLVECFSQHGDLMKIPTILKNNGLILNIETSVV